MPLCTHLIFQQKWLKYRRGFKRVPSNTSPHLEWNLCQKTYTSCLSMHGCEFSGYRDWNLFIILVFKRWREDRNVQMRHKLPKLITRHAETGVQNVFRIWISKHTIRWNIIVRLSWIGLFFTMIDVSTNYAIVISVVSRHLCKSLLCDKSHTHKNSLQKAYNNFIRRGQRSYYKIQSPSKAL